MDISNVAVVERRELIVEGLRRIFSRTRMRINTHHPSIEDLINSAMMNEPPHAILVGTGDSLTEGHLMRLRDMFPSAKIVLMVHQGDGSQAMLLGHAADGVVLTWSLPAALVKSLEIILLGQRIILDGTCMCAKEEKPRLPETVYPLPVQVQVGKSVPLENLSEREVEVMNLLSNGSPNKIIARELGISEATVKVHVKAILRKTKARNRTEAALLMRSMVRPSSTAN